MNKYKNNTLIFFLCFCLYLSSNCIFSNSPIDFFQCFLPNLNNICLLNNPLFCSKPIKLDFSSGSNFIFQFVDKQGNIKYKSVNDGFYSDNIHPFIDVDDQNISNLPILNYDNINYINEKYIYQAQKIDIRHSYFFYSFIYKNQKYMVDFRNPSNNIVFDENYYISNILIQLSPYKSEIADTVIGNGYLFTGGKVVEIKWKKKSNKPIEIVDENGCPVYISKGVTLWLITDNNTQINYK